MKVKSTEPGRVVVSTRGHDAGIWYAVLATADERHVLLCDGDTRKLAKPKKKQFKHFEPLPLTIAVAGRGGSGGGIADSDLRKALKAARDAYETNTAGTRAVACQQKEECAFVQE
ncbi:MAG: KOW domain-containing RNA-binding protein [Clostridia bacterium]